MVYSPEERKQRAKESRARTQARIKADPEWSARKRQKQLEYDKSPDRQQKRRKATSLRMSDSEYAEKYRNKRNEVARTPEAREKLYAYWRQRYHSDLDYRLKKILRTRVRNALKGNSNISESQLFQYVGCSLEDLKNHVSAQFLEGMSWDNLGDWEIDHKQPCCSFDLTDPTQRAMCFHFTNLQPLWKTDHVLKSLGDLRRAQIKT